MHRPSTFFNPSRLTRKSVALKVLTWTLIGCIFASWSPLSAQATTRKAKTSKTAKIGKIFIVSPKIPSTGSLVASGGAIALKYNVNDPDIDAVKIKVSNGNGSDAASGLGGSTSARVFLYEGKNTIELFGFRGDVLDSEAKTTVTVECNSECITGAPPSGGMIQVVNSTGTIPSTPSLPTTPAGIISLQIPGDGTVTDTSSIQPLIIVKDNSGISRLIIDVYNGGERLDTKILTKGDVIAGLWIASTKVKIAGGTNDIKVFDPDHLNQTMYEDSKKVTCNGNCASEPTQAKPKNITILQPTDNFKASENSLDAYLNILKDAKIKRLVYEVYNNGKRSDPSEPIAVPDSDANEKTVVVRSPVKIAKGDSTIRFFDPDKLGDPSHEASVKVSCKDCADSPATETAPITILRPKEPKPVNASSLEMYLAISESSNIENIKYEVFDGQHTVFTSDPIDVTKNKKEVPVTVWILKGSNTVSFFDVNDSTKRVSVKVSCEGDKCPLDFSIAKYPSSGQNSRVIVGIEQAGASSASTETKPLLDFYFSTPFIFDRRKVCKEPAADHSPEQETTYENCLSDNRDRRLLPRFGFWGEIRLASTPDQIAAAQVFPTTLVNQLSTSRAVVDLVQSFDFLAGVEGRLKTANGNFLSLIPGRPQRSSLYFAFGAGAINPLTARRESAQIFVIPPVGDPQRDEFIARYGLPPAQPSASPPLPAKEFVGLVPLERDRFMRQWYAGLRLKTFYCENSTCRRYINSFPAIVDFMFGQNEAVTGGSRKHGGTPDPNNPDKLIGQKNSYVLRIDGFYPFPFKEASFLFFYGTAMMKIGAGGVKVSSPLFLDTPGSEVQLSDPRVYIPPTNLLKLQQPNRDYYKIGVGINLSELFNRNKPAAAVAAGSDNE